MRLAAVAPVACELDMKTLVSTRGRAFPLAVLADEFVGEGAYDVVYATASYTLSATAGSRNCPLPGVSP